MKHEIETNLKVLIGLPLTSASRAANMQMFGFGGWIDAAEGEPRKVGEYALHIQCAWRINSKNRIFVAHNDMFYPSGDYEIEPENWNWDISENNRCDEEIKDLINQHNSRPLIVNEISADNFGSLNLKFSEDVGLEIFPNDSLPEEFWRFLKPSTNDNHFVITGSGIEIE